MENKIGKVTVDFGDGRVNEVSGESIIAIGLTNTSDHVKVECNVEGVFSANMLIAAIRSMRNIFKESGPKR